MRNKKPPFIVIEGTDGSGVSTQAELLEKKLRDEGREVYLTKEPTDGPSGAMVRLALAGRLISQKKALTSPSLEARVLALLFAADRMDHLYNDIIPKLDIGVIVISDRYYLSSYAYQGIAINDVEWLQAINSQCLRPDLTIFLDVDAEICYKRMQRRRWHIELFEEQQKLEEVHHSYLKAIQYLMGRGEKIVMVDGNQPLNAVQRDIFRAVRKILSGNKAAPLPQLSFQEASMGVRQAHL